jgi:uncharacterized membrane protein YccC
VNHLERVASILGTLLMGVAAYIVISDRKARAIQARSAPAVEEMAEDLKEAWAGHHTR